MLGAHPHPGGTVIRALRPHAAQVAARVGGRDHPLAHVAHGIFEGVVPYPDLWDYRLVVRYGEGPDSVEADGYRFFPTVGELDLHLICQGRHERLWQVLGAHPRHYRTLDGEVQGTSFAVWAPRARGVSVIGDFDGWSGSTVPMRRLGESGIWEVFRPGIGPGALYKYRIHGCDGRAVDHADPLAFAAEVPPATASTIVAADDYVWHDETWLAQRERTDAVAAPLRIYEVHLGSWRPGLRYRELAEQLAEHVAAQGFSHVELLPVAEHPFGGSWGYQVSSYYAPTARLGSPNDFRAFVDHLHTAGIGVILDWVPAHFPRDEWALARMDGAALYEHADPRRGEHPDWGTSVFDFGRPEVRNFLVANARYWIEEFHIDGLRVDAVASMLYLDYSRPAGGWEPNVHGGRENLEAVGFLVEMNNAVCHRGVITVAEESTTWPGVTRATSSGGLGFTMKWNMGWMHDTLGYLRHDQVHRSWHHDEITFAAVYAASENYILPISHDEVVHGKGTLWTRMPGDDFAKAAGVRALLAYMWAHPGKKLLFMGQEYGQVAEWSHDSGLDWHEFDQPLHRGVAALIRDLNARYRDRPALWARDTDPGGFSWINADDRTANVIAFLRYDHEGAMLACVCNFSGSEHRDYRLGLPRVGPWQEVLNTDATNYGGSGIGNLGAVTATGRPWHGRAASAAVTLAANSVVWLEPSSQ